MAAVGDPGDEGLPDSVMRAVCVTESEGEPDGVTVTVHVSVFALLRDGTLEGLARPDSDADFDADAHADDDVVTVPRGLSEALPDAAPDADTEPVRLAVALAHDENDGELVGESEADALRLTHALDEAESVVVFVAAADHDADTVASEASADPVAHTE